MRFRQLRVLISALVAVAILTPPFLYAGALSVNLFHHTSNHHSRSQQRIPQPIKVRALLAAPVRSSSRFAPEVPSRGNKRASSLSPALGKYVSAGEGAVLTGVFCPLRC